MLVRNHLRSFSFSGHRWSYGGLDRTPCSFLRCKVQLESWKYCFNIQHLIRSLSVWIHDAQQIGTRTGGGTWRHSTHLLCVAIRLRLVMPCVLLYRAAHSVAMSILVCCTCMRYSGGFQVKVDRLALGCYSVDRRSRNVPWSYSWNLVDIPSRPLF